MYRCIVETCSWRFTQPSDLAYHFKTFCHHPGCQKEFCTTSEYELHSRTHVISNRQYASVIKREPEEHILSPLVPMSDKSVSPQFSPAESVMPLTPLEDFETGNFPPLFVNLCDQEYEASHIYSTTGIYSTSRPIYSDGFYMKRDRNIEKRDLRWGSNQCSYMSPQSQKPDKKEFFIQENVHPLCFSSSFSSNRIEIIDNNSFSVEPMNLDVHKLSTHTHITECHNESVGRSDLDILSGSVLDELQPVSNIYTPVKAEPEDTDFVNSFSSGSLSNTYLVTTEIPRTGKEVSDVDELSLVSKETVSCSGRQNVPKRMCNARAFRQLSEDHASFDGILDLQDIRYLSEDLLVCNSGQADNFEKLNHIRTFTCALCQPLGTKKHRSRNRNKTCYQEPYSDPPVLYPLYFNPKKHENMLLDSSAPSYYDLNTGCSFLRGPGVLMELSALPFLSYMSLLESANLSVTGVCNIEDRLATMERYLQEPPSDSLLKKTMKESRQLKKLFALSGKTTISGPEKKLSGPISNSGLKHQ